LAAPILFGGVIYLLILMFFDSVEMLASNFFSREVLFIIGLTFLFFELNRLVIIGMNAFQQYPGSIMTRLAAQFIASFMLTAATISAALYLYFINIEGFSTIATELIAFNGIYLFAAVFYHIYYFSIYFLYKQNDELILAEKTQRESLELELNTYKNQINPEFLFLTLEVIIDTLHGNKKKADELIGHLATIYRYTLDNQKNELVSLSQELSSVEPVLEVFRSKYPDAVFVEKDNPTGDEYSMVPGTLLILMEHAVIHNLVSANMPLNFRIRVHNGEMEISHSLNERIASDANDMSRINNLLKTYNYLSNDEFRRYAKKRKQFYHIPLLRVEEE
jgi:hypothetical protein